MSENREDSWKKFILEDNKRLALEGSFKELEVGIKFAAKKPAPSEVEQPAESRFEAMYEDFRILPEKYQDQIIQEITERHQKGENPKDLVLVAINLTEAYKQFLADEETGSEKQEDWKQEFDEILKKFKTIRKKPNKNTVTPKGSGAVKKKEPVN
jgi:hypothetical protein